ncbi:hypothetical protein GJ744_003427 [Endocarpon pusillum]|uniref:Uncharacterized protein n=1 Tax=Endocarpon pusillum TaxID=364733 RepID=A0A8H7DY66_9EURO|nr:hypothetical protein GJ744_003427 [Endocarpon pusillum]
MFVQRSITECYFSAVCIHYLTFKYFDIDMTEAARRDYLLDGCFAFQDYAITHWSDHLSSVIKEGPQ